MLSRVLEAIAAAVIALFALAWLFNFFAAPKYMYSLSSSVRSADRTLVLSVGQLNPYPMSRECYRYVFIYPENVVLDTRDIQWDYLVAQFTCDGELSASWSSRTNVEVKATPAENGSLPHGSVIKLNDSSGSVQVAYRIGA